MCQRNSISRCSKTYLSRLFAISHMQSFFLGNLHLQCIFFFGNLYSHNNFYDCTCKYLRNRKMIVSFLLNSFHNSLLSISHLKKCTAVLTKYFTGKACREI
nr:unnamed protein product [Callosobruchus analis]